MPIVNDDGYHENELESTITSLPIPSELKRVYITGSEPADALKPQEGTPVALEVNASPEPPYEPIRPEPYGLNPPERGPGFASPPRPEPKVLYKTKTGIEITDQDIENATSVALGAGPAAIESKSFIKNYINSFIKEPQYKKPIQDPYEGMDATDKTLHAIYEALDIPVPAYVTPKKTSWVEATNAEIKKTAELSSMSPKEASEHYWNVLTTQGDYSAGKFEHAYWKANKEGNAHEIFSEHVGKLYKDNPKQQIPFEEAPKGWDHVGDFQEPRLIPPPKLSPKEQFAKGVADTQNKLKAEMVELEAQFVKLNEKAAAAGYTTPAFRGLSLHGKEPNPVHNFEKQPGLYSSESPMLADMYASYLSHHPGYKIPEGSFGEGASVAPVYINTSKYHVADAKGAMWSSFNNKAINEAKKRGAPGVVIKNVYDEPNSTFALGKPRTIYITFEEGASTVKSRFAERFDKNSKSMLKMIPAIAVGGSAGYVAIQEEQ